MRPRDKSQQSQALHFWVFIFNLYIFLSVFSYRRLEIAAINIPSMLCKYIVDWTFSLITV